ncbi:winged helix-turn-helix transcriptional regulator [Rheinheimera sp. YQF-2]|uniref:Winged helix-turn-helix transcriptional regulator n=1 Tax=Rheinheimera lutimaris TaxID=2740584 RepID=A0A7Y5EHC8_9GAMM|nr:winged helix-turn-helix domain-containing protein [Rheinheimera lutimaris]NRQ41612.1 winged helix-turn-helix transcriptional regulator [Rheinheimera lutimaris]
MSQAAVVQLFKALGDPVRLQIVQRLSNGVPLCMGELSKDLGISRQGARKQIQALVTANVVQLHPVGREVKVQLDATALTQGRDFIAALEAQWDQRLQALKQFTEQ